MCQNVSKKSFINKTQILSKNFEPPWNFCPGRVKEVHPPSKDEGLTDILYYIMKTVLETRKSNLGVNRVWLQFHICFIMTLYNATNIIMIQNATDIKTKCDSFIIKSNIYYKIWPFYYKMWQLLENVKFITKYVSTTIIRLFYFHQRFVVTSSKKIEYC